MSRYPAMEVNLPPAVPQPCNDCPWRRNAKPGWLGPYTAEEWTKTAHGETPVACHQTIPDGLDFDGRDDVAKWEETPGLRQCKGMAIFRANIVKLPWNPTDARHGTKADRETVFSWDNEFIDHHAVE